MIRLMYLAGRCLDGAERDRGSKVHAVPDGWRALCGATMGRRSAGFYEAARAVEVTCPRCLRVVISRNRQLFK